jgi:hypothetical protein
MEPSTIPVYQGHSYMVWWNVLVSMGMAKREHAAGMSV